MAVMTKTQSVLVCEHPVTYSTEFVEFGRTVEEIDDGAGYRSVELAYLDWKDLGCPEKITVTIEPGDKLND